MTIETQRDADALKRVEAAALREMLGSIEPGMTTAELDGVGKAALERCGARSAPQLAYRFPGARCISVNEEVAHGFPGPRVVRAGDVVHAAHCTRSRTASSVFSSRAIRASSKRGWSSRSSRSFPRGAPSSRKRGTVGRSSPRKAASARNTSTR